jgi:anti-sigma regulatory factor (Ser/Thr protein kinase)
VSAATLELELPGDTAAPALARRAVDERVDHGFDDEATGTLLLLVTELVTNAILHAGAPGAPVLLRIETGPARLRVEVHDRGPGFEIRGEPKPRGSRGGYGLFLVERMSSRWGVDRSEHTYVWFELDRPGH